MRARFFKRLLKRLEAHTPSFFCRIQLQILANLTADAFQVKAPLLLKKKTKKALADYAAFTKSCMENRSTSFERMYCLSYKAGAMLRRITALSEREYLQRLVFLLYRNIGIIMHGELPGFITVPECYYSRIYTPQQCEIMSAMDSGIVAGICGGGQLLFTGRLTEGCVSCTACLKEVNKDA